MIPNVGQVPEKKLWNEFFAHSATGCELRTGQAAETPAKPAFTEGIQGRTKVAGRVLSVV
jgi:hypothetical protein